MTATLSAQADTHYNAEMGSWNIFYPSYSFLHGLV